MQSEPKVIRIEADEELPPMAGTLSETWPPLGQVPSEMPEPEQLQNPGFDEGGRFLPWAVSSAKQWDHDRKGQIDFHANQAIHHLTVLVEWLELTTDDYKWIHRSAEKLESMLDVEVGE